MRPSRTLAIGALGAFFAAGLAGAAHAQSQDINPTINTCNKTADTNANANPPPAKILPTPITPSLLTSGQPCQQVVSGKGLTPSALANLQRGFDFYSWLTFIALNSPADGKPIGAGGRRDAMTQWEAVSNYRPLADVMLPQGATPTWGTRIVPDACKPLDGPGKIVVQVGEEAWNQPFRTGPLIDQNGNYAVFDILMNKVMFDFILTNNLYSKQGQEASTLNPIEFPIGINQGSGPTPGPGKMGAVMVKVSWRVLDPVKDAAFMRTFHTANALIFFPGPPHTLQGPTCIERTLGLIGFHVGHKTNFAPQWVWTSFEHVANAPTTSEATDKKLLPRYSFFNAACDPKKQNCLRNQTPPDPWPPKIDVTFHDPVYHSQIVREETLPPFTADIAELNKSFRAILKGTVWENYMLLATQWPSDHANPTDPLGVPAPTYLANTTLETYSQGEVPLASSSCMACHGNATDQHRPALASDFTFILEKAQSKTAP